jgi:predicted unusual protein kinase regulating ubiquinone biosynthesis (AarF/ABC1/UbiB family)
MRDTAELQAWKSTRPIRFRAARAYLLTVRILLGYAWLGLLRPVLGPSLYASKLVARHRSTSKRLVAAILDLKGLFIKVGQLISILTNVLPPEFREELEQLQDSVPARPPNEVTARIRKELGKAPHEVFAEFNPVPIASASLAQVHEARLHDGRRVAVKVQHADIEEISRLDLNVLGGVLALIQFFVRIKGLESYHADITQMISEELDFNHEAANIATIAANFSGSTEVHFPRVVAEFSTQRVLTTEFVVGTKVTDFDELARLGVDRPALAKRILTAYCQMVFTDGVFHADPHPGNIIAHPDGSITFVDFGAVGRLAPNVKSGIPMFWNGIIKRDPQMISAGLRQAGFFSRDPDMGEDDVAERAINYFQKRFFEQMTVEGFSLKDIQVDMKSKIEALADLEKLDISFRDLQRSFQVPKEWVIFERAALLLVGLGTQIDPNMNPLNTIGPYLQEFVLGGKDTDWKAQVSTAVREMAMSALAIPDRTNRFLERANRGDIQIHVGGLRESALLLYAGVHQIIFMFLAIALGALGYVLEVRDEPRLAIAAWSGTALSVVFLVGSIWRARAISAGLRKSRRA